MAKAKKTAGTALVSMAELEKMYATEAKAVAETEPLMGVPTIRTRGKKFRFDEKELKSPLRVIVLGYSMVNSYYDDDYDPENPSSPACYAIGEVGKENVMAPPDSVPKRQHEKCTGCPQNAFGTADKGKGKACRNQRRVAVMMADDTRPDPQIALLTLPPTALKPFSSYVKQIANVVGRPLHGVVTDFNFDDDQDFPCPVPTLVDRISDPGLAQRAMAARERAVKELLFAPIDTSGYKAPGAKETKGGKPAKKKGGKGKY